MKGIYEKLMDGDSLTKQEILQGIQEFKDAGNALIKLGPCFRIVRKECTMCECKLADIADARGYEWKT